MIPKTIHYCWFGRNPKPKLAEKCIRSWKKYCPDYEIIEWNEDNFNLSTAPLYVRQAYEAKKWAFVTDYVRLKLVYDYGGIYMDTDVELLKNLDFLLPNYAYFGFEYSSFVNTGLGFGAVKGLPILKEMMDDYEDIPFVLPGGDYDETMCIHRNFNVFLRHGLIQKDTRQILEEGILILPSTYLCPKAYNDLRRKKAKETISIHWYAASWLTKEQVKLDRDSYRKDYIMHLPNRMLRKVLGYECYERLKKRLKK